MATTERKGVMKQPNAVILDRDGVINDNRAIVHVNRPDEFVLFEDVPRAIKRLNESGMLVFVATNQGGVGLGYMTSEQLSDIHVEMVRQLNEQGARVDAVAVCTHAPGEGCDCRKPKPGMLQTLQSEFGFCFATSFMVGDRETDVDAGRAVGMRTVRIGRSKTKADFCTPDLTSAADWIIHAASL